MSDLKPERTKSWEVGMNFRFLTDPHIRRHMVSRRLSYNQTFNPNLAVGKYSNLSMCRPVTCATGVWNSPSTTSTHGAASPGHPGLTYSFNKNKIRELARNVINPSPARHSPSTRLNLLPATASEPPTSSCVKAAPWAISLFCRPHARRQRQHLCRQHRRRIQDHNQGQLRGISNSAQYSPRAASPGATPSAGRTSRQAACFSARLRVSYSPAHRPFSTSTECRRLQVPHSTLGYVSISGSDHVNPEQWYGTIASGDMVASVLHILGHQRAPAGGYHQLPHTPPSACQRMRHPRIACRTQPLDDLQQGALRPQGCSFSR